ALAARIERIGVEGGEGSDCGRAGRHRVGILGQRAEEALEILVEHGVDRDRSHERIELLPGGQVPVDQEVAHLEKGALLAALLDRDAVVAQDALLAVDERDRALARARVRIAWIQRDVAGLRAQLADVDSAFAFAADHDRKVEGLPVDAQLCGFRHWGLPNPRIVIQGLSPRVVAGCAASLVPFGLGGWSERVRVQQLFDLSGRTALVTGGGRGIGRHIAIGLAEAGADGALASRKGDKRRAPAAATPEPRRRARALPGDLADATSIDALADAALAAVGRLDILINNAGVIWGAPTLDFPMKGWDRTFAINVRGLWQLSQRVARHMAERGGGAIVHVSSISGLRGSPEEKEPAIAYNAAKGAVITLTKDMAVKVARHGIRVNSIAPGAFDTDMMDWVRGDAEKEARFFAQIPLARAGGEDDVKGAAVFLASDAAAYITGHNLIVDGGWFVSA